MLHKSNLETIDFNELYIEQKSKTTFTPKDEKSWDKKSHGINERVYKSYYNDTFISKLNIDPEDTLMDMGCGAGNLSIPLAQTVAHVHAVDFSANMLNYLKEHQKESDLQNITTHKQSWYDSWESIPKVDIVIASRSMEVRDMKVALQKMYDQAKKAVYLTYKVGGSFVDPLALNTIASEITPKPDYIYLLNILYSMGIHASIEFIQSEGRGSYYTTAQEYADSVAWSLGELSNDEKEKLKELYTTMSQKEKESLKAPHKWAFISWEK
jgi:SAM-dependent methyltransferase